MSVSENEVDSQIRLLRKILEEMRKDLDPSPEDLSVLSRVDPDLSGLLSAVRAQFSRLRRRDRQFASVIAMTSDLNMTRGEGLLTSIVERAHDLLGSDITYVSAYSSDSETFKVKAVIGTASVEFLGMDVPAGVGIATRVVQSRGPVWVADYARATDVPHDATIDRIVAEEDIKSILGVPLMSGQKVIGVLFVADRTERHYSADELALARTFAGHAAVVLDQAALMADLDLARQEAEDERKRAESVANDVQRAAQLHERLTRLVTEDPRADPIAYVLSDHLGREVAFVDVRGDLVAGTHRFRDFQKEALAKLRESREPSASIQLSDGPLDVVTGVDAGPDHLGALLIERKCDPLSDAERRSVERSAIAFALVALQRRALVDAEDRVRGELVHDLIGPKADALRAILRIQERGFDTEAPWTLLHFRVDDRDVDRVRRRLTAVSGVLSANAQDDFWVFASDVGEIDSVQRVGTALAPIGTVSVFERADNLTTLISAVEKVRDVRSLIEGLGVREGAHHAALFAPYAGLFGGRGKDAAQFIQQILGPVLRWDGQRGSQLTETLLAAFDESQSVTRIARRMQIHPNTVRQRLQRIEDLLGPPITPDHRFRLEAAVRLHSAMSAIAPHTSPQQ